MRNRTVGTILIAATMLFFSPAPGVAEDAATLLKRGNKLFSSGDYQEALKVFEEGNKVAPKMPVFIRSMAFSQLKLFQHKLARGLMQQYLKQFPAVKDRKKIKELVDSLDVVVQTTLSIESTPPGAEVFIDAEAAGTWGKTPLVDQTLQPGKHLVILKADGYFITTEAIEIKAKESKRLKIELEVPLKVSSTPAGASVHLGSPTAETLGNAPLETGIKPGSQAVYLKLDGYKTYKKELLVEASKPVSIEAVMELGIKVASTPPGASVTIDGNAVQGVTPLESGIAPGRHTVVVKLQGFKAATEQVEIAPGKPGDVNVTLAGGGALSMRTDVEGASVKLGGHELGKTPLESLAVPAGSQILTVSHPDRRVWSKALDFSDTEVVTAEIKLGRPTWPVWVAGGVSLAAIIAGSVTGIMVKGHHGDYAAIAEQYPDPDKRSQKQQEYCDANLSYCDNTISNVSTATFVTAGVVAAAGVVYYLVWGRHSETITRTAASATAQR